MSAVPCVVHRLAMALKEGAGAVQVGTPEVLKNRDHNGEHLEHRHVGGAHPHMQRFWVSSATTAGDAARELRDHADLHARAAAEHRKLATHHGHDIQFEPRADQKQWGGNDVHQQKLNLEAAHPHLDFGRAHAHAQLASLHHTASNLATGIGFRLQHGHDARSQGHQLQTVRDHLDDWSYYARPRHEVDADEQDRQAGEDYERQREEEDNPRGRNPGSFDVGRAGYWGP